MWTGAYVCATFVAFALSLCMSTATETRIASIVRAAPERLEVRLKHAAFIDAPGIAEVMTARMHLCGHDKVGILLVIPTDVELDVAAMNMDHYRINASADGLLAVAVAAESLMMETMSRLYIAYFPPVFPVHVFTQVNEARTWLEQRIAEFHDAGS